jgi:hypothetical protein
MIITTLVLILKILGIVVPLLIAVAYFTIAERKIMGAIQRRRGPNAVGYIGLLQPLADGLKLFVKETTLPNSSNISIFLLAPSMAFILSIMGWAVSPFSDGTFISDLNLEVLYLFAGESSGLTVNCSNKHKKIREPVTSKIGIWDQIQLVIDNDALTLKQKDNLIKQLREIVSVENQEFKINPEILNNVRAIIEYYYPDLFEKIQLKVSESNRSWLKKLPLIVEESVEVIFLVLVATLNTKQSASKTVLITHLTIYLNALAELKESNSFSEQDLEFLNGLFKDVINFDLHLSQIKVKGMPERMKIVWKYVQLLIDLLVKEKFLTQGSTLDTRPTDLTNDYLDELESKLINKNTGRKNAKWDPGVNRNKKNPYPVTTISLSEPIKENTQDLSSFFFSKWPQVAPDQSTNNMSSKRHIMLRKGESKMEMSEDCIKALILAGSVPVRFNYNLFLKALNGDVNHPLFEEYRRRDYHESGMISKKSEEAYKLQRHVMLNIETLQRVKSIISYYEKQNSEHVHYKTFITAILEKELRKERKKKKNFALNVVELLNDLSNMSNSVAQDLFKSFYEYILDAFDIYRDGSLQWDKLCSGFFNYYIKVEKSFLSDTQKEDIKKLTKIVTYLGLSKLSNFYFISKIHPQKPNNIFEIYLERIYNIEDNCTAEEKQCIEKNNILYQNYVTAQSNYSLNLNINFKKKLMELYKGKYFYFTLKLSANGRQVNEGFYPHPHSGSIFRFCEVKPEIVSPEGLKHLKRAISFSFKNNFQSFVEHEKWVDANLELIKKNPDKSLEVYIYSSAYFKAINGEEIGTLVRLDHVASVASIWAILANCEYSKRITNITPEQNTVYQPYLCVARDFLKPALETFVKDYKKKVKSNIDQIILKTVKDIFLQNVLEKKFHKPIIMPHLYGLTNTGLGKILIRYANSKNPKLRFHLLRDTPMFKALCNRLHNALNKFSPNATKIRRIMSNTEKRIIGFVEKKMRASKSKAENAGLGIDIKYTNVIKHIDCTMFWDYKVKNKVKWSVYDPEKQYSIPKVFTNMSKKSDQRENEGGLAPLFTHSYDGLILRFTTIVGFNLFNLIPIGIHDANMSHPNYTDRLRRAWQDAICLALGTGEKTNKILIEEVWLVPTLNNLKDYLDEDLHTDLLKDIDLIKKYWDNQWKKHKGLESLVNGSEIYSSKYNWDYE